MSHLIVALDFPTLEEAELMAKDLVDHVAGFKVGMELLMAEGPRAIATISGLGRPIFADAKLHDIPNTVARAASRIRDAGARWVTVHAAGGVEMMQAAVSGMVDPGVLAVTMLTSLGPTDLPGLGITAPAEDHVVSMARLASTAAVEGVVCSPAEISAVKRAETGLKVFTPGVRPQQATADDQKRVATPEAAARAGADYLVIGRPITRADDPGRTAREIAATIASLR